ncbi:MAG TPA: hypothetical protein VL282_04735 [Tepidisphaeraceae bacterium]|nr:hypothetical protein [Tepidisphaeraceae bacterium]
METRQLDTFIRAIHQRWVIWRALERVAIGVLVACAAAAILYPILVWRGQPAMPMILGAMGLGALCGAIFGLKSRPTQLDAAIEADRQLKLQDLLATAFSAARGLAGTDEWHATVIAMAEAKCRAIAPRDVILTRLGVRAWGGIGLAAAFLLTLGILSTNPVVTQAVATAQGRSVAKPDSVANPPAESRGFMQTTPSRNANPGEPSGENHSQIPTPTDSQASSANASSNKNGNTSDGTGGGQSKTDTKLESHLPSSASPSNISNDSASRTASGGAASAHPTNGTEKTGANMTGQTGTSTPPWQSITWSSARQQALQDARDGKTPATYHDLIRDYFNRDGVDH